LSLLGDIVKDHRPIKCHVITISRGRYYYRMPSYP